jgi:hypothetical protein
MTHSIRIVTLAAAAFALIALTACDTQPTAKSVTTTAPKAGDSAAEAELKRQEAALQRTLKEGVSTGIAATTLVAGIFQDDRKALNTGIRFGGRGGLVAGSYVQSLQRRYITKESWLRKLRDDISATNDKAERAIAAMRAVLAQQQQELAAARAAGGDAAAREEAQAQANLGTMRGLILATEARREEVLTTRTLQLVPGQETGVDDQVAALSSRIQTMREIAELLASEV